MKSRLDVMAVEQSILFDELMLKVNEWGYSRIPVYEESFDSITGVLYIKDLLPYVNDHTNLDWNTLLRPAFLFLNLKNR